MTTQETRDARRLATYDAIYARAMLLARLERIAAWVRGHGFSADVAGDRVEVLIPFTKAGTDGGFVKETARTFADARDVLGY